MPALHEPGRAGQVHIQLFAQDESSPVQWRLLSGNNREVGRGSEQFDGVESCRLAIKQLQCGASELECTVHRAESSTWVWRVLRDGELVVSSGRRYDRLIRCKQGLAHFLEQFVDAEIGAGVMFSRARRWQSAGRHPGGSEPRASLLS